MEDRYEIREKIGQGGMGSVYRAFDARMNRVVAIKRIRPEGGDASVGESAAQIVQEAGALASLQHPHIVTVYDVGTDEEGPYVVMEFINGSTVDELIERAPLTWPDFRELAIQTQEALIAAQERNLIHRDLKPSNLMLTWLPSGKFQVKVVDFGLAKLVENTTLGNLEQADSVFGSIFFMSPEQFERATLDARADMYSIGCVYYHALTQTYPFNGGTGMEVMTAHLNHQVTHLRESRPDLPGWVCDWVMWHLNRQPADRPAGAREALRIFFSNDSQLQQPQSNSPPATQAMSTGSAASAPDQPKRPRLIIPGAVPPSAVPVPEPVPAPPPAPPPAGIPEPPRTQTAPQPLLPPEGSLPSVHASSEPTPAPAPPPPTPPVAAPMPPPAAVLQPAPTQPPAPPLALGQTPVAQPVGHQAQSAMPVAMPKPGLSNGAKVAMAVVLGLLVVVALIFVLGKSSTNKQNEMYNKLVAIAAKDDAKEVPVTKAELEVLLNAAVAVGANPQRGTVYKALWLAKSSDGTDVDATIAEFATKRPMADDIREVLIRDVLRKRKNPSVVPVLMAFCRSTGDTRAAKAAIEACRFMATGKEFPQYVDIIEYNSNDSIRKAAEENILEILKKAPNHEELGEKIISAHANAIGEVRYSLTRLLGPVGGAKAAEVVKKSLASEDKKEQLAAAVGLSLWADDSMFETLIDYLKSVEDEQLRSRAFDAAYRFLTLPERKRDADISEDFWKTLARSARNKEEQMKIIRGLANNETDDWAIVVVEYFVDEGKNDDVIDLAEKALDRMRSRAEELNGDDEQDADADEEADADTDAEADQDADADAEKE